MPLNPLREARLLLNDITPLEQDCGAFCAAACCRSPGPEEEETGMLLFPGEEGFYGREDAQWMRLLPSEAMYRGKSVPLLICHTPCPRHQRPLACRIFPLAPRFTAQGVGVRMDARGAALCPLMDSGVQGLSPAFVQTVNQAFSLLASHPEQGDYLRFLAKQVKEYERMLRMFSRRRRSTHDDNDSR